MNAWPWPILVWPLICLTGCLTGCRTAGELKAPAIQTAIRVVLEQQVKDWNEGSIEKFMRGYDRSEATRFASGGDVRRGWQTVLERYRVKYGNRAAMGRLSFSDIDITVAADDAALVFGRWRLEREKDELGGWFTLFFRKTQDGWRIVHDHTSAAEPPPTELKR